MQAATILAALQRAAQAPAMAGIYIKSVSISAVRDWAHDPIMTIVWSMPDASASIEADSLLGITASVLSRPSDTTIGLPRDLASPDELESAIMSAAWTLGAWDIVRLERPPLPTGADWRESRYGLRSDFGHGSYIIAGQPLSSGDHASDDTCAIAASQGYVTWRLIPLALASPTMRSRWSSKDKTLQSDCTRAGEHRFARLADWHHPSSPGHANEHIYQMGRSNHGNRSKASRQKQAAYHCQKCGYPHGADWLDDGETCPKCLLVQ